MPAISHRLARILSGLVFLAFAATAFAENSTPPIVPKSTIALFSGKDLTGFYTWLRNLKYEDPDKVFTVVHIDGGPAIRASGQHFGGFVTKERYAKYRLTLEFRWGLITWEPRKDKARDAGILLHCQGPDGNAGVDFNSPWMRSVEYQIIEGGTDASFREGKILFQSEGAELFYRKIELHPLNGARAL